MTWLLEPSRWTRPQPAVCYPTLLACVPNEGSQSPVRTIVEIQTRRSIRVEKRLKVKHTAGLHPVSWLNLDRLIVARVS